MTERLILVDAEDREVGTAGKMEAHREGRLHRAFSVFVFDDEGRLLMQRRAAGKYHSGGLWTNTACGHPRPGEATADAARRRLREEMGIDCPLRPLFAFTYRAELDDGLVEHELDHVLAGVCPHHPDPDPAEAEGWTWADPADVRLDVERRPERYTAWFRLALGRVLREVEGGALAARRQPVSQSSRTSASSATTEA